MIPEISLSVCRDLRRMPFMMHTSRRDKGATRIREMVIGQGRFGRRCYFCDFAFGMTDGYEVHNLDGDHSNNDPENLVPICELCHIPFHLDLVAKKWPKNPGKIIFLPEMTQPELNNLLQAIFYAMVMQKKTNDKDTADKQPAVHPHTVYKRLLDRAGLVEQNELGEIVRPGLSDPFILSRVLADMDEETYAQRNMLLSNCRYLPWADSFIDQVDLWNANGAAFSRLDIGAWQDIASIEG